MTDMPEYVMNEPTMDVNTIIKRYSNLVVAYNNLVDSYATVIEERNDLMGLEIVKHGHLIDLPKAFDPSERPVKCSVCATVISLYHGYKPRYCSNCGAKFDEEDEKPHDNFCKAHGCSLETRQSCCGCKDYFDNKQRMKKEEEE